MSEPRTEGDRGGQGEAKEENILLLLLLLLLGPPANVRPSLTLPALSPAFVCNCEEAEGELRAGY